MGEAFLKGAGNSAPFAVPLGRLLAGEGAAIRTVQFNGVSGRAALYVTPVEDRPTGEDSSEPPSLTQIRIAGMLAYTNTQPDGADELVVRIEEHRQEIRFGVVLPHEHAYGSCRCFVLRADGELTVRNSLRSDLSEEDPRGTAAHYLGLFLADTLVNPSARGMDALRRGRYKSSKIRTTLEALTDSLFEHPGLVSAAQYARRGLRGRTLARSI